MESKSEQKIAAANIQAGLDMQNDLELDDINDSYDNEYTGNNNNNNNNNQEINDIQDNRDDQFFADGPAF